MAYEFNGTNQYISAASALGGSAPLTIACWANAKTTNTMTLASISMDATGTNNQRFQLVLNSQQVRAGAIGAVNGIAQTSGTFSVNTWFHAAAVFESSSSRAAYRAGGNIGTNSTSVTPSGMTQTLIGGIVSLGSFASFADALIAEVGIWNAALTAVEIASLAKGFSPRRVRPQSLLFHAPLVRDLQDTRAGLALTNNNAATVTTHPRIYS